MRILERGLRAHGYEVVCAETAQHALQFIQEVSAMRARTAE